MQLDPTSSDFSYQINRPRISGSGIPDLKINRLSKWSVASWRLEEWSLGPQTTVKTLEGQEAFSCRLELDINTAADFSGEITSQSLASIFAEQINLGAEIAEHGDIK